MVGDYRGSLIKFSQFLLNRETDDLRIDFYKSLLEAGFYEKGEDYYDIEEINNVINRSYSVEVLSVSQLNKSLNILVNDGSILQKNNKYSLSKERKDAILSEINKKKDIMSTIDFTYESILKDVSLEITEDDINLLKNNFYFILNSFFNSSGILSSNTLVGFMVNNDKYLEEFIIIMNNCLNNIKDASLREIQKRSIRKFFLLKIPEVEEYFYQTLTNYIFFEVMSIDPELTELQSKILSEYELFLDTNVINDLLLKTRPKHDFVKNLIELANKLDVTLIYTIDTKNEFSDFIARGRRQYDKLEQKVGFKGIEKIAHSDDLLKEFVNEKKQNKALSFEGFMIKYENELDNLLDNYNIQIYDKSLDDIKKNTNLFRFNQSVLACAKKWGIFKIERVILHDSIHLLFISEKRKYERESLLGPKIWFLTNDASLYCVSQMMREYENKPLSIRTDTLFDIFCFLSPINISNKEKGNITRAFLHFCENSLTVPLPSIDLDRLSLIAGPWMEYDSVKTETIITVSSKIFVKKYIDNAQRAIEQGRIPKPAQPIIDQALDEVLQNKDEEISSLKMEVEKYKEESVLKMKKIEEEEKEKIIYREETRILKSGLKQYRIIILILLIMSLGFIDFIFKESWKFLVEIEVAILLSISSIWYIYRWINK